MTEGGSGSSAACKGEYVAGGRRMAQRRPLLDGGAVVSDVRRRLVEAQNWLGVAVAEGANRISRFGLSIEDGRGMMVQKMERIGNRRSDPRSKIRSGQLPWEKVWTAMSGFGAQFEAQLQRSKAGIPEAMLRMIWNRGAPRPLIASLSLGLPAQGGEALEAKHVFDIAMSGEQVAKRLDGVPVYTVSNSANEFVLISDLNTSKSLGIFCFREADAEALLSQVLAVHLDDCSGNRSRDNFFIAIISSNDISVNMHVVRGLCYADYIIHVFMDELSVLATTLLHTRFWLFTSSYTRCVLSQLC